MKKTLTTLLLIFAMIILLTGCASIDYEITINKDGSGKASYVYAYKKDYLESMEITSEELSHKAKLAAEEQGYTIEPYSDDIYEGFKASKELKDITEKISFSTIFGEEYVTDNEDGNIKIDGKKYSQKTAINLTKMEDASMFGIVIKYSVKLPTKAGENNATTVSEDGKTLTWDLKTGEVNEIQFEGDSSNGILVYILIGAIILVVAGIAVVIIIGKKQKKGVTDYDKKEKETVKEEKE